MLQDKVKDLSRRVLPVPLVLVLTACASPSPDVDDLGLPQPEAYVDVTVLESEPSGSFAELGAVRGSICYRSTFELELKRKDAAIRDMRRQAREMGADAIIRVDCVPGKKRNWLTNCLATMTCSGLAIRSEGVR